MTTLRAYRVAMSGGAATASKLRVYRAASSGTAGVALAGSGTITAEPQEVCYLTAVKAPGSPTPTSYTWTQISGPTIAFATSAETAWFTVPSLRPPATTDVVFGVVATSGGVSSAQQRMTVTILPQTDWTRVFGGDWVGGKTMGNGSVPVAPLPASADLALDTDGTPYIDTTGAAPHPSIATDTDGVPYYAATGGSQSLAYDTDGVPYLS